MRPAVHAYVSDLLLHSLPLLRRRNTCASMLSIEMGSFNERWPFGRSVRLGPNLRYGRLFRAWMSMPTVPPSRWFPLWRFMSCSRPADLSPVQSGRVRARAGRATENTNEGNLDGAGYRRNGIRAPASRGHAAHLRASTHSLSTHTLASRRSNTRHRDGAPGRGDLSRGDLKGASRWHGAGRRRRERRLPAGRREP